MLTLRFLPEFLTRPSATLPTGEGMDFFEALKTSLPDGRLAIFIWRYLTDLAYSVGVMPNLSLN